MTTQQKTSARNNTERKGGAAAPSLCIGQAVRLRAGFCGSKGRDCSPPSPQNVRRLPLMRYQNGVYISRVIFWLSELPILTHAGIPNNDNCT